MGLDVLLVLGGYLLGTLPTAGVVGRHEGHDPMREGSHNPGATNVYRTAGWRAGLVVLLVDGAKGAAAAGLGWVIGDHVLGLACGAAAVAGHVFPVFRRFQGGKGVATSGGATLVLFPLIGLAAMAVFGVVIAVTRRVSIGSIGLAVLVPVAAAATGAPGVEVALLVAMAVLVVVRHHENINRLLHGTEGPIGAGR